MPRGRKKADVAPQDLLNEVLASIEETEQKLKALKAQKKDIICTCKREKYVNSGRQGKTRIRIRNLKLARPESFPALPVFLS